MKSKKIFSMKTKGPWLAFLLLLLAMIAQLHFQGRVLFSSSGVFNVWISDAWGAETSQQFFDPYSFSHLLHGICFFGLFYLLIPKISLSWRFVFSMALEAGWEILENSEFIIGRYREQTAALGYNGDSIINSCGDLLSCGLGFFLANYLGLKKSILLIAIIELLMLLSIRDSLLLNIIMLIHPLREIKSWQIR